MFQRQCCWLAVLVISRLHLNGFSVSTEKHMGCSAAHGCLKTPPSQSWYMQCYHLPVYLCHVLYHTCALNYICPNVCPSEQPGLACAAPGSGNSVVLIPG